VANPRIAAQLIVYGGRPEFDLAGVLTELAQAGYAGAEIGTNFMDADRVQVKAAFANAGIALSGIHGGYGSIPDASWQAKAIEFCKDMGAKHIICSGVADNDSLEGYIETGAVFNAFGARCKEAGLNFLYHNHAWEFRVFDGVKGIHKLCEVTDPDLVKLNVDVYWVTVGGEKPEEFIERYGNRVGYYHFKDGPYTPTGSIAPGPYEFTELGRGSVDLAAALAAARRHDPQWIVYEQDQSKLDPTEAARISLAHLRSLGL